MPSQFILLIIVGGYGAFLYGDAKLHTIVRNLTFLTVALIAVRWLVLRIDEAIRTARHGRRLEQLNAFAGKIVQGETDGRGFYSGGTTTVSGQLEGRSLELAVTLGDRPLIAYELRIKGEALEFDARRPGLLARLVGTPPVVALGRGVPGPELDKVLRHLVLERGVARISLCAGRLRAEKPLADRDLRLDRLLDVSRA